MAVAVLRKSANVTWRILAEILCTMFKTRRVNSTSGLNGCCVSELFESHDRGGVTYPCH